MKKSLIQLITEFILGHKYYINIVHYYGEHEYIAQSYIHHTLQAANRQKQVLDTMRTFTYIETVSFRSHKQYPFPTQKQTAQ